MPGYSTSVSITESGLYLRVGLKNKFINGNTAYEKIHELSEKFKNGELKQNIQDFFHRVSIMTSYGNFKVYLIEAVNFDINVTNKTINRKDRDGLIQEITLQQYYREQYNKEIRFLDQPLLMCYKKTPQGDQETIYLIPELCLLTGMDEDMRSQEGLKKNMTSRTKVTPKDRMNRINEFKNLVYKQNKEKRRRTNKMTNETYTLPDPNEIREQWGLNIGDCKEFKGRELAPPNIMFRDGEGRINGGKFRGMKMTQPVSLEAGTWACICTKQNEETARQMIKSLQSASGNLGVAVEFPIRFLAHNSRRAEEWVDCLKNLDFNGGCKLIFIVLDRNSKQFYKLIKKYIYTEVGVPVQVVLKENASKNLSYYSNVLNQIVVKMGGQLYTIPMDSGLTKNVKKFY